MRTQIAAISFFSTLLVCGCAPTFESKLDAPAACTQEASVSASPVTEKLAPLDARPHLPDATQSPCPSDSGLAACFSAEQDAIRQQRFKLLYQDREYCRDAYDRAVRDAF